MRRSESSLVFRVEAKVTWGKLSRSRQDLYKDIGFGGSLEGTRLLPDELTTDFWDFKDLPFHRTKMRRSVFIHSSYNGQVVNKENEVKVEEVLHWRVVVSDYYRESKRQKKASDHFRLCNWNMPLLLGS